MNCLLHIHFIDFPNIRILFQVLVKPKIFELFNTTTPENTEGRLECKATGRPAPIIRFRKQGQNEPFVEGSNENGRLVTILNT